jgi:mannosyltransferase
LIRSLPLAILLCFETCLLFWTLDLLPVWSDEVFTVKTVALPVREIIPIVKHDIHPPLYYILLRQWTKLPLPWTGVAALRAFSALWALLAVFLLDLFWTRSWAPFARWVSLSLFALSPCLLLYGRMARSYSMQAALVLLSLGLLQRWMKEPRSWPRGCGASAAVLALLYTHYIPGLAVIAGFLLVAWRTLGPVRVAAFSLAIGAGYLPWAISLLDALRRWGEAGSFASSYTLTGSLVLEQFLKICFGLISLTIGETFPAVSLLLVPMLVVLAILGLRTPEFSRQFAILLAIAAGVAYLGVSRWVSFPFLPARLLWLLPFLCLAIGLGILHLRVAPVRNGLLLVVLLSYVTSDVLYFRRQDFLNPGYAAPLREIAATLNARALREDLILVDPYNTDPQAMRVYLTASAPVIVLDAGGVSQSWERIRSARTVWIVRNTRDISPGHTTSDVEAAACAGRSRRDTLLEPYAPWQQVALSVAGIHPVPNYFYQFTRCTLDNLE